MERTRHIRLRDLHSWTGVSLGLFLFMVVFTGCFALFHHEIRLWEDGLWNHPIAEQPVYIHPIFENWVNTQADPQDIRFVEVSAPTPLTPYYSALLHLNGMDTPISARWDSESGALLPPPQSGIADWMLNFHRQLMWPHRLGGEDIGRSIIAIAGIALLLSLLTGIVTHRKILRDAFTLRLDRSLRLLLTDAHKVIGLWGLPFFTISAFTGAYLGITVLVTPIIAALAFKGDTQALRAAFYTPGLEATGTAAQMRPVDAFFAKPHPDKGTTPFHIVITNWGDEHALYEAYYPTPPKLQLDERLTFKAVTGEQLPNPPKTTAKAITYAMAPLHFGNYAGIWGKVLYAVLGLMLAGLIALGLSMWLEHRPKHVYLRKIVIGATTGLALATLGLFFLRNTALTTGTTFFAIWATVFIFNLFHPRPKRAMKHLLIGAGVLLLASPLTLFT